MVETNKLWFNEEARVWCLGEQGPELHHCRHCGKELDLNFFLCKRHNMAFCERCEKKSHKIPRKEKWKTGRLCPSIEVTHVHVQVKATKRVDSYGKMVGD